MYINQITIKNFRGYYGENNLQFSVDPSKNITIIAGNNGFGKTTFLTSLLWGLYGKLIVDVDDIYRNEVNQIGGYKEFCRRIISKRAAAQVVINHYNAKEDLALAKAAYDDFFFSIKIIFSEVLIPHISCEKVEITRKYFPKNDVEELQILIDGKINELTKNVGAELFINDFILPKEIAKFFFFDAEKIVSMAEIKTAEQKRYLSNAYAEVLGIKKYTELKANLENVQLRLRKKSAVKSDREKLAILNKTLEQKEKLLKLHTHELEEKQQSINTKLISSDRYQEQLIREGSSLSFAEFKRYKEQQVLIGTALNTVKARFNELLDLAPFAMIFSKLGSIKTQLENEANNSSVSASLLKSKFDLISRAITNQKDDISKFAINDKALLDIIKSILIPAVKTDTKPLLDFTAQQQNGFLAIYDTLNTSYKTNFKSLIADQKRLQSKFNSLQKVLREAESREKDPIVAQIRSLKNKLDTDIASLQTEVYQLNALIANIKNDINVLTRQISELTKKIVIEDTDYEKDRTVTRLISKLERFLSKLKSSKKKSLEANLSQAFNQLMHKSGFISKVNVTINGEMIDVDLLDEKGDIIDKESLSKGEQQLYATAMLKALIEESNIKFPVFIDSPLQKFDKDHSKNIITDFYPNLSNQVILYPLLQKELSESEYDLLLPCIGKTYLIGQKVNYGSSFQEVIPSKLFRTYEEKLENVQ